MVYIGHILSHTLKRIGTAVINYTLTHTLNQCKTNRSVLIRFHFIEFLMNRDFYGDHHINGNVHFFCAKVLFNSTTEPFFFFFSLRLVLTVCVCVFENNVNVFVPFYEMRERFAETRSGVEIQINTKLIKFSTSTLNIRYIFNGFRTILMFMFYLHNKNNNK